MSQCDQILAMLQRGDYVTPATIHEQTGSLAGHSRIAELRERGHNIRCTIHHNGAMKWGVYTLDQLPTLDQWKSISQTEPTGSSAATSVRRADTVAPAGSALL